MNEDDDQRSIQGIQKYCDLLEELKLRIKAVQSIVNEDVTKESFGHYIFADEFMFLQIRKILELIVFGSMASNISLYEKTYSKYSRHNKAKQILEMLEKVNKDYYPLPLQESPEKNGVLINVQKDCLTRDDFIFLYDACSKIIHSTNPYSEAKKVDLKISIDDWMHRIASLLWFHRIKLANTNTAWLVYLIHPETKKAHAIRTMSVDTNM